MELTVAITGASGTIYAYRTLQLLAASGVVETINLIMSGTAATVAQVETGVNLRDPDLAKINAWLGLDTDSKLIRFWRLDNLAAKPSSGSNKQAGMIVVPCSMGTLGAIASGAVSFEDGVREFEKERQGMREALRLFKQNDLDRAPEADQAQDVGGRAVAVQVHDGRGGDHRWHQYDRHWRALSREAGGQAAPSSLAAMLAAAERLARDQDFMRVDFYEVDGQPLFGEFCLYPGSGLDPFDPPSLDSWLGAQWSAERSAAPRRAALPWLRPSPAS